MRVKHPFHLQESWVICFFLGLVMLNFPFLHIFNKDVQLFGIPLLIIYLFFGWPLSIVIIWLFSLLLGKGVEAGDSSSRQDQP
jgi:hypothetical protein